MENDSRHSTASSARFVARCADADAGELLAAEAWAAGAEGIEELDVAATTELVIYASPDRVDAVRAAVVAAAGDAAIGGVEAVPDRDWSEEWKAGLRAVEISPRLVIRPSFVEYRPAPGQLELVIDPGQAFGTGGHASTLLALEWIDVLAPELPHEARVLDVGTGTGVLALAAIGLANAGTVAFDLDPLAAPAALENALCNGITSDLHLFVGGLDAVGPVEFDLVLANLLKSEMLPLAQGIAERTRPGGCLVLSGLLACDIDEVSRVFTEVGFTQAGSRATADATGDRWVSLLMRR